MLGGFLFAKKEPALRDEARKCFFKFVDGMVPICIEEERVGPGLRRQSPRIRRRAKHRVSTGYARGPLAPARDRKE